MSIDKTALVEPGAVIHETASVGPFCYIGKDVRIDAEAVIHAHVYLEGHCEIGSGVQIFSHTKVGNPSICVNIADRTHIREFVEIGVEGSEKVSIAKESMIMAYSKIKSGVHLADNTILTNSVILEENVKCEERVIIGGLSYIAKGCRIGTGVMIGGASKVENSMPPFTLVEGNPAKARGLNLIGIRRRFQDPSVTSAIKKVYKTTYKGGIDKDAAQTFVVQENDIYAKRFARFILESF